jgi:5'-3' exonuclease
MLHVSIQNCGKKLRSGEVYKAKDYKPFFLHLLLNNIRWVKKEYSKAYGEIIVCIDSRNNWRKDIYAEYKGHRSKKRAESNIDYTEFYQLITDTVEKLKDFFPFKVVEVDYAEADDVISVLSKEYSKNQDVLIISEDKDFKQLLVYPRVKQFKPIEKKFVSITPEELTEWRLEHTIKGDEGDNVPRVIDETEFTDEFIKYLKSNDVIEYEVHKVRALDFGKHLIETYDPEKSIYIKKRFMFKDFLKNLEANLDSHPLYRENLKRNEILVLAENIPEYIHNKILVEFTECTSTVDTMKMFEYFCDNNLNVLINNIQDFYITNGVLATPKVTNDSEWF